MITPVLELFLPTLLAALLIIELRNAQGNFSILI